MDYLKFFFSPSKTKHFLVFSLLAITVMFTPALAAPGGVTIQILIESGRSILQPNFAQSYGECLEADGTASLSLDEDGWRCDEPKTQALSCADTDDGLCVIDNVDLRVVQGCDDATGQEIVELEFEALRSAGPLDLEWQALDWQTTMRCTSVTGLCGNFDDGGDADRALLGEIIGDCADLDGDGAAEFFTEGNRVRCSSYAADDGQPLVEYGRARVRMPCGLGLEIAVDSMRMGQSMSAFGTDGGLWGLETRIEP